MCFTYVQCFCRDLFIAFPIYYHICVATAQGPYTDANFRNRVSSCILIKRFSCHFEEKFSVYLYLFAEL